MEPKKFSKKLLQRLPLYLQYLKSLPEHSTNVSSGSIAAALNLGAVQVRKDLAKVSVSGQRRVGRSKEKLIQDIESFLDFAATTGTIVIGTGKLGIALLDYAGFEEAGLNIMAGFDLEPAAKRSAGGKPIYSMDRLQAFCQCYRIHIGIITVPAEYAQSVCDRLIANGVQAIWNFAPVHLNIPDHVLVQYEDLSLSLGALRMQLKNKETTLSTTNEFNQDSLVG